MAKTSSVEKNNRRRKLTKKFASKRARLKAIAYDKATDIWGMDITVCTTARTDDEARALLTAFNFPFRQ